MYTEAQSLAEVNSSTTLDLIGSNQFMCPQWLSFFSRLCPAPFLSYLYPQQSRESGSALIKEVKVHPELVLFSAAFTPPLIGIGPPCSGEDGALVCFV